MKLASNEELLSLAILCELLSCALSFGGKVEYEQLIALASKVQDACALDEHLGSLLASDYESFSSERNEVFYDFSLVNVPLEASFYDEGRDNGKMRIIAAGIFARAALARANGVSENEDSFNVLFALLARLARLAASNEPNKNAKESYEDLLIELFSRVINPVADEFAAKLRTHKNSAIFADLAGLLELVLEMFREIFNIAKPLEKAHSAADAALNRVPYQPRVPTQFSKINMEEVTAFKGMD